MAELDLDAIESRAEAATKGPWAAERREVDDLYFGRSEFTCLDSPQRNLFAVFSLPLADAEFIAHAREDVPVLVAEVRRLRALIGGA